MADAAPLKVFVSYAHKDESHRQELADHLASLRYQNWISTWSDHDVTAGRELDPAIASALDAAHIHLLLVSPSFLHSEYCQKETRRILEKHMAGTTRAIPIIVRPVDWMDLPLAKLLALPRDGKPVTQWGDRDVAWLDVAKGIKAVVKEIRASGRPAEGSREVEPLAMSTSPVEPLDADNRGPASWDQMFAFFLSREGLGANPADARRLAEAWARRGTTEADFAHFVEVFGWVRSTSGMGLERGEAFQHAQTLARKWSPVQFAKLVRRFGAMRRAGEGRWESLTEAEKVLDLP